MTLTMIKLKTFLIKITEIMIDINYNVDEAGWKKHFPYYKKHISKSVDETLKFISVRTTKDISITFFLTSNNKIKELNLKYRKKNNPTNVLSFPMQSLYTNTYLLGDIVLAYKMLLKEATEQKISRYDHLCKMTIHGMLHLLGYDHETEKQFKQMRKFENLIFNSIKNNYDQ